GQSHPHGQLRQGTPGCARLERGGVGAEPPCGERRRQLTKRGAPPHCRGRAHFDHSIAVPTASGAICAVGVRPSAMPPCPATSANNASVSVHTVAENVSCLLISRSFGISVARSITAQM